MDYYDILGVPEGATLDEIKSAYRKKAKLLHPDVNSAPNAKQAFTALTIAFETLKKNPNLPKPKIKVKPKDVPFSGLYVDVHFPYLTGGDNYQKVNVNKEFLLKGGKIRLYHGPGKTPPEKRQLM
jgi:hypothetical protein